MRLYRGAQRLLALEEQVVAEVAEDGDGGARGHVRDRRLDRARRDRARAPALRVPGAPPRAARRRSGSSTPRRSSSGSPRASSSSASSARRGAIAASSSSRSSATRSSSPARPATRSPGTTVDARRAARGRADRDAGGRRRPPADRGRAAASRACGCAISTSRLELGLQESVTSAVRAGYGVTFISRSSIEADLAAGTLAEARVEGLELEREIFLVRASGRVGDARRPRLRRVRPRAPAVIVRWSLAELPARARRARDRAAVPRREPAGRRLVELPRRRRLVGGAVGRGSRSPPGADGLLAVGGGSAIDTAKAASAATGLPLVSVPTTYSGAEWATSFGVRATRPADRRRRRRRAARRRSSTRSR